MPVRMEMLSQRDLERPLAVQYREGIQAAVDEWFAALQRSSLWQMCKYRHQCDWGGKVKDVVLGEFWWCWYSLKAAAACRCLDSAASRHWAEAQVHELYMRIGAVVA